MDFLARQGRNVGYLFYVTSPNATTFRTVKEIPNYVHDVAPQFICMIVLEMLILRFRSHKPYKVPWHDFITSIGHGIVYTVFSTLTRGAELVGYQWLYDRRLVSFNWNSPVTWWTAAICVDFCYYWVHRTVHELNIGWASHQVHHSSEEYNLSTALRQSMFQKFFGIVFYLPLGLIGVPIPALLVHMQFNLLYQFWIHTEVVSTLGPLEWVLNTPSHHRVHHGSNPWCLDRNYAGVLIIWDRMFGTFEPERQGEQIVYGLVDQPQTFNVPWLQVFYFRDVLQKAAAQETWGDTFRGLLYGPGWTPGAPRLGFPMEETGDPPRKKYNPKLPFIIELYLIGHALVSILIQQTLISNVDNHSAVFILLHMVFLLVSLGNIGAMYDGWKWAGQLETARCVAFLVFTSNYSTFDNQLANMVVEGYCALSALLWGSHTLLQQFGAVKPTNKKHR